MNRRIRTSEGPASARRNTRSAWQRFIRGHRAKSVALWSLAFPMILALTLSGLGDTASRILLMVLGFSLIIIVHELGHFVVARLCSVKCEVFSLGIGPRMVGWRKGTGFSFGNEPDVIDTTLKDSINSAIEGDIQQTGVTFKEKTNRLSEVQKELGETDYRISWLPLGGYVRMLGQDDMDPNATSTDPRAFNNRPIWQRMCIVSAGVVMNVIFAAVIFAIVFRHGVDFPPARVGMVVFDSPAEKAGLQIGDNIVVIDGDRPSEGFVEYTDLFVASALGSPGHEIRLEVARNGQTFEKRVTPVKGQAKRLQIGVAPLPSLKLAAYEADSLKPLAKQDPAFATELLKLRMGDHITAVNGQPVNDYVSYYNAIQASHGQTVTLHVVKDDATPPGQDLTFKPELTARAGVTDFAGLLGLCPRMRLEEPTAGGPAAEAGLQNGDLVLRVEATENPTVTEFIAAIEKNPKHAVSLVVQRGAETKTISVTPDENKEGKGHIGAPYTLDFSSPVVAAAADSSGPFGKVMRGSKIVSINGETVANWDDVVRIARANPDKILTFIFDDTSGQAMTVDLKPSDERNRDLQKVEYELAPAAGGLPLELVMLTQKSETALGAIRMGLAHTETFILQTYSTIRGLFAGSVPVTELHSFLGIAKVGYDVQEKGFIYLLFILAVVSVNLAVANFLPLPIVDGGLFILLVLEKLRGKPLPARVLGAINMAGLCLLAGLFLFVTINNDLGMFFGK